MPRVDARVRVIHDRPPRRDAAYVLYWMIGARRPSWNVALDRAVSWAVELKQPLVVLEAIRSDHRWASDRIHRFVLDGMRDNARAFARSGVGYYPYVESAPHAGKGLLRELAARASVVITDRTPVFDLPALVTAAARAIDTRFEEVDASGILPLDAPPPAVVFPTAYAFRRYLQRELPPYLAARPRATPVRAGTLATPVPFTPEILRRWPIADAAQLDGAFDLRALPIDHAVAAVDLASGASAARARLDAFIDGPLSRYGADRRAYVYTLDQFAAAATHDPVWNAAQRQLLVEGRIHTYLRMLWGKKILEWTASPRDALSVMIALNDRFALDGRDPNSYSGIGWVLGRYDRPWGPERPIFGTVRYMSSGNTARKLRLGAYLDRYGPAGTGSPPGRDKTGRFR